VPRTAPSIAFVGGEEYESRIARLNASFTEEEVEVGIAKLKMNKAEGKDRVRNEHIKDAGVLVPLWTLLFTMCLRLGVYPEAWRHCILKLVYKGKGDPTEPASWRGVSLKCVSGKLMSALVASRLFRYLDRTFTIPPEQHGFVRGRSTMTAMDTLLRAIRSNLAVPRRPLYAVFVDFRAAFDTVSREAIIQKLCEAGVKGDILKLLMGILQGNQIVMDDGVRRHEGFQQTTGLPQGDTLSSLLFVTALWDLPSRIHAQLPDVKVLLYADDLVLYGVSIRQVNKALQAVADLAA
jgi:fumarate reductase subunit D